MARDASAVFQFFGFLAGSRTIEILGDAMPTLSVPNTVFQEQVEATAGETTTEKGRSARETPSVTLTLRTKAA
jgi:hypothetical protein